ncbi:MAG: type II secretion system F family protein [Acidimicrobiia bacterium]
MISVLRFAIGVALWSGATLLLSTTRPFNRMSLADRLRPYQHATTVTPRHAGVMSIESIRDVVAPIAGDIGERIGSVIGINEQLSVRLQRVHAELDVAGFRMRQVGSALITLVGAAVMTLMTRPNPIVALALVAGAPFAAFLASELRLSARSTSHQVRLFAELPVVSEQLGMLLASGFSLGSALARLSERGNGAAARDLRRVVARMRQGLSEADALREWATISNVDAVERMVAVLALNREATDIGRLISDEARAIRREAQRQLVETIEKRSQMVWIPVTVATLVPGVIFVFIPFIDVMRTFGGS